MAKFITVRNEVAKVIFLQVCVCPRGGEGGAWSSGGAWSRGAWSGGVSAPGGCLVLGGLGPGGTRSGGGVGIPVCTEADPRERRLLLRTVRILQECILVSKDSPPLKEGSTVFFLNLAI